MIAVAVVDDHEVTRKGLEELISNSSGVAHLISFSSPADLLPYLMDEGEIDVVVLDVAFDSGRMEGFSACEHICSLEDAPEVLMLSTYPESTYARKAFEAGASGYVMKEESADVVAEAIRAVSSGEKWMSRGLAEKLALEHLQEEASAEGPLAKLSTTDVRMLRLVARGKSKREVSDALSITIDSLYTKRPRVAKKLGLSSARELDEWARRHDHILIH